MTDVMTKPHHLIASDRVEAPLCVGRTATRLATSNG
jgi:hypothetical protein